MVEYRYHSLKARLFSSSVVLVNSLVLVRSYLLKFCSTNNKVIDFKVIFQMSILMVQIETLLLLIELLLLV